MSDTQRQVKMVAEQAMANLVERAKRLQLSSVSTIQVNDERLFGKSSAFDNSPTAATMKKSKVSVAAAVGVGVGAQRATFGTSRKPRKIEAEPTPPPPSPREQCMIAELRDEYNQTDQLIEKMLCDAATLNEDMLNCSQHQRDFNLLQEIELETTKRSVDTLFEALSAECERPDLKDVLRRCCNALERSKERVCDHDLQLNTEDTTTNQTLAATWPHICYTSDENLDNELPPPDYLADETMELMPSNTKRQLDEILTHTADNMDMVELIIPQT
ncbi:hypothetical protein KR044_009679 [Drosophila immigrans]|nr:hypothetical protein KR044_009679 [Drosophila immigrans]